MKTRAQQSNVEAMKCWGVLLKWKLEPMWTFMAPPTGLRFLHGIRLPYSCQKAKLPATNSIENSLHSISGGQHSEEALEVHRIHRMLRQVQLAHCAHLQGTHEVRRQHRSFPQTHIDARIRRLTAQQMRHSMTSCWRPIGAHVFAFSFTTRLHSFQQTHALCGYEDLRRRFRQ